tara:strand:+ start:68 stop:595 length:528 start_codon:yes stop_codon:yes gene_type:complete
MITIDGGTGKIMHNGLNVAAAPMVDAWVITSDFTTDASSPDYMNSNWARQDLGNSLFEKIGTGMSESSGIFTFPSTGKYQINAEWSINANGVTDSNVLGSIFATYNNSTYTRIARASISVTGTEGYNITAQAMIDVTDTSQIKVRLASDSSNGVLFEGQNGAMRTGIIFKRIGDT